VADILVTVHSYNVYLVLAVALSTSIWGLILYFKKLPMPKAWRIMLIITGILGLLQGVLGVSMVALGLRPGTGTGIYYLHYVYGAIVAFGLPVGLTYATGGKNLRRDVLIFSIVLLIMVAAGVRAWMTGPHV
jgi:heme A synthase